VRSALDVASRLGVLVVRDFLEPDVRDALLADVRAAPSDAAPPYHASDAGSRDPRCAHSRVASMPRARTQAFSDRICALMPDAGRHFGLTLQDQTDPSFLTYLAGHHALPRPDTRPEPDGRIVRERKVTTVTFLTGQGDDGDGLSFAGGELVLYGLPGSGSERHGLWIGGERGMLVAFRSDVLHEVRPVTRGERRTVVSSYL
jgi:SM-20-related protein